MLVCSSWLTNTASLAESPLRAGRPLILGANNNESPTRLAPKLLQRSHTHWVRSFFPALEFIEGKRSFEADEELEAIKSLADDGYQVFLTIKWDFRNGNWRVPGPNSENEAKCFDFAKQLVCSFPNQLSGVALVNEITVDTLPVDMQVTEPSVVPMIRFLKRLETFIASLQIKARNGDDLPIYSGGFTRQDMPAMQNDLVLRDYMRWLSESPNIFGVNFHLHQRDLMQAEASLQHVRSLIPDKPFAITEFSLIWRYKMNLSQRLDAGPPGVAFCERYNRDPDSSVADYLSLASAENVSQEEWHAFLASRDWFDPKLISKYCRLMQRYGVTLATYGFAHGMGGEPKRVTTQTTPWMLNMIFPRSLVTQSEAGQDAVTYGFFDDWVHIQKTAVSGG